MPKKAKQQEACTPAGCSCKVEAMVSVDELGQMVLSKDLRTKAKIKPGDKLAVVTWEQAGKVCCITLIKTDEFVDMVKNALGPIVQQVMKR
jgi:bifunctional DNA-binding transcriptional regulator/antitoxin component of YhaV-PrlF toxin-antitoxin module